MGHLKDEWGKLSKPNSESSGQTGHVLNLHLPVCSSWYRAPVATFIGSSGKHSLRHLHQQVGMLAADLSTWMQQLCTVHQAHPRASSDCSVVKPMQVQQLTVFCIAVCVLRKCSAG